MQIWKMEKYPYGDVRMPHHWYPPQMVQGFELTQMTGVQLYKVDLNDTLALRKRLARVKRDWEMAGGDVLVLDDKLFDMDIKLAQMYEPVVSTENMLALVLEGHIYFDIKYGPDEDDWIRISLQRGDLIAVPKGSTYRSTLSAKNYVKIQRFKKDEHQSEAMKFNKNGIIQTHEAAKNGLIQTHEPMREHAISVE